MRPSERLTLTVLLALSAAVAMVRPEGGGGRLALLAVLVALVLLLARLGEGAGRLGLLRDFFPIAAVAAVFSILQPVIEAVNPHRWDAFFAAADERWLGPLVQAWRGALGRPDPFTDAIYLVYLSYYFFPVVLGAAARREGTERLERLVFPVLLAFYLSFAGYFLWPTSGPRVPAAEEASLGGGLVAEAARAFLRATETTTLDAFPSGHTAVSLVAAGAGARLLPRAAPLVVGWAAGIVFATVYIQVHYAVDVLGGLLLAAATLLLAPRLARSLGRIEGGSLRRGSRRRRPGGSGS
jgi:membrane-associated phospholipid phosphatase